MMRLRPIVSILLFIALTFPLMIYISQLLADLIGTGPEQTLGPAAVWITAVAGWIKHVWNQTGTESTSPKDSDDNATDDTPADTTTDSPGPDVEPQSQAYSFRDTADTGRQSSLRRSNTDILDETETRLDDHITFYDNGTIELDNYDDFNMCSQMMLYVIAKRLAYEDQCVDTPQVTGADLRDRFKYTKVDLMLFLHEAGDQLTPHYRIGGRDNDIPYSEIDELEVAVDVQPLSTITDWTVNEQQTVRPFLQSQITDTIDYLSEARSRYSEMSSRDNPYSHYPSGRSDSIEEPVKNACKHVRQYPVEIGYDNHWKTFSRYAEALLDYLADGSPEKTDHCVPDMKRALKHMRKQAENESTL